MSNLKGWKRNWQALPIEDQPEKIVLRKKNEEMLLQRDREEEIGTNSSGFIYRIKQLLNLN